MGRKASSKDVRIIGRCLQDNEKTLFSDQQQILCQLAPVTKVDTFPDSRRDSDFVTKTVALGLKEAGFSWTGTIHSKLNPLQLIIARTPISVEIQGAYSTYYYLDTMACGHQVAVYPQTGLVNQKRHRCFVCGEAQLALKFPPKSAPSPDPKRKKAA